MYLVNKFRFRQKSMKILRTEEASLPFLTNETAQFLFSAVWDILVSTSGWDNNFTLLFPKKCCVSQNIIVSIKSFKYLRFVYLSATYQFMLANVHLSRCLILFLGSLPVNVCLLWVNNRVLSLVWRKKLPPFDQIHIFFYRYLSLL